MQTLGTITFAVPEANQSFLHDPETWGIAFLGLLTLVFITAKRNHGFGKAVALVVSMVIPLGVTFTILGLGFGLLSESANQWLEKQNNLESSSR